MLRWSALIVTTALAASSAAAQRTCNTAPGFDFLSLDCIQCTVSHSGGDVIIEYGAEPVVRSVGRISTGVRVGDAIVSIDGALITTPSGSDRFAHPGDNPIRFTVRRDGRAVDVTVRPASGCATAIVQQSLDLQDQLRLVRQRDSAASGGGGGGAVGARGGRMSRPIQYQFGTNLGDQDSANRALIQHLTERQTGTLRMNGSVVDTVYTVRGGQVDTTYRINSIIRDSALHQIHFRFDTLRGHLRLNMDPSREGAMTIVMHGDSDRLHRADTISGVTLQAMAQRIRAATGRGAIGGAMIGSSSRGWIGFGVDCGGCTVTSEGNGAVWHFEGNPVIAGIDPDGPADIAGVLAGDVLRSIDGMSITSNEGGQRFSSLKPGQKVRLTVERRGRSVDLVITAGKRPN